MTTTSFPVIRHDPTERSFRCTTRRPGIALFEHEVALFSFPFARRWLPEIAYGPTRADALAATRRVRIKRRIPIDRVSAASARVRDAWVDFQIRDDDANLTRRARLPAGQAASLLDAFRQLLGPRFHCTIAPDELHAASKRQPLGDRIAAFLIFLLGLATIAAGVANGWRFNGFKGETIEWGLIGGGALVAWAGWLAVWRGSPRSRRTKKFDRARQPWRARPLGLLLRALGALAFILGYFNALVVLWARHLLNRPFDPLAADEAAAQLAYVLLPTGAVLLYLGYRLSLRGAARADRRPQAVLGRPVLYLRSFEDDNKRSLNQVSFVAGLLGLNPFGWVVKILGPIANLYPMRLVRLALGRPADTAEEQMAAFFARRGGLVAIGRPGERMATGGARRVYVDDDAWQRRVLELQDRSWATIIQPAATQGVWWEIEQTLGRTPPRKLLLCLVNFANDPEAYDQFVRRMSALTGRPYPRSLGNCLFARFDDDWAPVLLPTVTRTEWAWPVAGCSVDFARTLRDFLPRAAPPPRPRPAPPGRAVTPWLAVPVALAAWVALPAWLAYVAQQQSTAYVLVSAAINGPTRDVERDGLKWTLPASWEAGRSFQTAADAWVSPQGRFTVAVTKFDQGTTVDEMIDKFAARRPKGRQELWRRTVRVDQADWQEVAWWAAVDADAEPVLRVARFRAGPTGNVALELIMPFALYDAAHWAPRRVLDKVALVRPPSLPAEQPAAADADAAAAGTAPAPAIARPPASRRVEHVGLYAPCRLWLDPAWSRHPNDVDPGHDHFRLNGKDDVQLDLEHSPPNADVSTPQEVFDEARTDATLNHETVTALPPVTGGGRTWLQFERLEVPGQVGATDYFQEIRRSSKGPEGTITYTLTAYAKTGLTPAQFRALALEIFDGIAVVPALAARVFPADYSYSVRPAAGWKRTPDDDADADATAVGWGHAEPDAFIAITRPKPAAEAGYKSPQAFAATLEPEDDVKVTPKKKVDVQQVGDLEWRGFRVDRTQKTQRESYLVRTTQAHGHLLAVTVLCDTADLPAVTKDLDAFLAGIKLLPVPEK